MAVSPKLWDGKAGKVVCRSERARETNHRLEQICVAVNNRYGEMMQTEGYATAEQVKNAYLGIGVEQNTLLKLFAGHNAQFARKVGTAGRKGHTTSIATSTN